MRYLVFDRSSAHSSMAMFEAGELIFEQAWDIEPTCAPTWLAELDQTLSERGLSVASFDHFVCGLGPGSFSGIRACLAALQGMSLPDGKLVYGLASAAALALGQAKGIENVTVVGDARRNRLWSVTYRVDPVAGRVRLLAGGVPTHTADDFLLMPTEALAQSVPAGSRIVSADWARLSHLLTDTFAVERIVACAVFPTAGNLGRLACAELEACVSEPLPIYLHPAVAVSELVI